MGWQAKFRKISLLSKFGIYWKQNHACEVVLNKIHRTLRVFPNIIKLEIALNLLSALIGA